MALGMRWRIVMRFAIAGFAIAFCAALCVVWEAPRALTVLFLFGSPAFRLFSRLQWGDGPSVDFFFIFLPAMNGVLYAVVGALVGGCRALSKH